MKVTERFDLSGRVSLVTGAGSGLGRAFCEALAECGSDVVCADIDEDGARETASAISGHGVRTMAVRADVSQPEEVRSLFHRVDHDFGRLDVLFNNAGIVSPARRIHEMPLEDWDRVIALDLTGVFLCMQEGLKIMLRQKSGSIINISSVLGLVGADPAVLAESNYNAAKAGVLGLTKQAAVEYAADGIRVNAILPGFHSGTKLGRGAGAKTEAQLRAYEDSIVRLTPMRRKGTPEELKGLAIYLASDASSFVTGASFVHDGGWCAW